jgi:hypothetical protein
MTRSGGAGKGKGSKGCRGAEHGQTYPEDRTGAVALRAALESAVQLGRGDEVSMQAEMAIPSKMAKMLGFATGGRTHYVATRYHAAACSKSAAAVRSSFLQVLQRAGIRGTSPTTFAQDVLSILALMMQMPTKHVSCSGHGFAGMPASRRLQPSGIKLASFNTSSTSRITGRNR